MRIKLNPNETVTRFLQCCLFVCLFSMLEYIGRSCILQVLNTVAAETEFSSYMAIVYESVQHSKEVMGKGMKKNQLPLPFPMQK